MAYEFRYIIYGFIPRKLPTERCLVLLNSISSFFCLPNTLSPRSYVLPATLVYSNGRLFSPYRTTIELCPVLLDIVVSSFHRIFYLHIYKSLLLHSNGRFSLSPPSPIHLPKLPIRKSNRLRSKATQQIIYPIRISPADSQHLVKPFHINRVHGWAESSKIASHSTGVVFTMTASNG
jgi:hypothetical protein